jgi:hypothetical protein
MIYLSLKKPPDNITERYLRIAHYLSTNRHIFKASYFSCVKKVDNSRYSRKNTEEKKFEYLKKKFPSFEKTVTPKEIDMAAINTEIEILKS